VSEAIRFLHALAQALSAASLYSPGHPATQRSVDTLFERLVTLLTVNPAPVLHFLGGAPVYAGRSLHELSDWPWSRRLSAAGVQRLECDVSATKESVATLIVQLLERLATGSEAPGGVVEIPGITYGGVAILEEAALEPADDVPGGVVEVAGGEPELDLDLDLEDELGAMSWILSEAARGAVARSEAEAVVRILGRLFDQHEVPQVAPGKDTARYPLIHPINTALLTMAAAAPWVDRLGQHRLGVAALLHDIGMALIPAHLNNRETLSTDERITVESHTALGARLLLEAGGNGFELAASVAYEHHLRPDNSGYPARRFRPAPHWASRLVSAASTYVSLRSPRPFRTRWSAGRALSFVEEGAGTVFDTEAASMVVRVVHSLSASRKPPG
jgi:hypothetical protein